MADKLIIEVELSGAAIADSPAFELRQILAEIAEAASCGLEGNQGDDNGTARDTNGNTVASWKLAYDRVPASEAGCWVDDYRGIYIPAHIVQIAQRYGFHDAELEDIAANMLSASPLVNVSQDEAVTLQEGCAAAEEWLNEYRAADGYSFGWHDGGFFYQSDAWWSEEGS